MFLSGTILLFHKLLQLCCEILVKFTAIFFCFGFFKHLEFIPMLQLDLSKEPIMLYLNSVLAPLLVKIKFSFGERFCTLKFFLRVNLQVSQLLLLLQINSILFNRNS